MDIKREKIKWAPRIRPELIQRLYESDANGMQDTEFCDNVGWRLYSRCETILMVKNNEVPCPRCGMVFEVNTLAPETITQCPTNGCGWHLTRSEYHQSWTKKRVWGANALPAFEEYYKRYPRAQRYKDKMLLIDRLIHSFHWNLKLNLPTRSAANNLIEGNHDQAIAFLDKLSGVDQVDKSAWRERVQTMMRRRKGK